MRATARDGTTLYYEDEGTGDALVLLPGLGMTVGSWAGIAPTLGRSCRILTIEPRGSGRSDKPAGPYTAELMAADVATVLDAAGVERAHLAGVSMGAMIAQDVALLRSERVASLVLISTYAIPDAWTTRVFEVRRALIQSLGIAAQMTFSILFLFSPATFVGRADLVELTEQLYAASPPDEDGYLAQIDFCLSHDTRASLGDIAVPCLVVSGADDLLIPPSAGRELAGGIPAARYLEIPGAAHLLGGQLPDLLRDLMSGFLLGQLEAPADPAGAPRWEPAGVRT